jgi:hypothetical protein
MPIDDAEAKTAGSSNPAAWESRLREAAEHVEHDVRKVIAYINDEVVPDIRRNGSDALRSAAAELERLARHMDDSNRRPRL